MELLFLQKIVEHYSKFKLPRLVRYLPLWIVLLLLLGHLVMLEKCGAITQHIKLRC